MAYTPSPTWQSLVDVLRQHVAQRGDQTVYTFLADGESEQGHLTFAEVDLHARAIAAHLQARGMAGQRALMLYNPGLEFITAFLGCLYAGTIAVPAYPPASKRHWPRLQSIVADSKPHMALTASAEQKKIQRVGSHLEGMSDLSWCSTDTIDLDLATAWQPPTLTPQSIAFLQYTSGSTSAPKGVMVSHGNLMHNEEVIRRGFGLDGSSTIVGWLPLYHDMGLIGNLLQPLYLGARLIFMSPVAFLQKPVRWLEAISRYGASTSGGPNFAYDLCAERVTPEQKEGLDLSGWKVAFSGAEPVRAETLDHFSAAFADCGFHRDAFYPCYGMAETTLMTTGGDPTAPPKVQRYDARALEADRAVAASGDADAADMRALVGCGQTGWQLEVRIADPEGRALPDGHVGEVWVAGDSIAQGYWRRPEVSQATFGARLQETNAQDEETSSPPFLRTGDLGFLEEGELFITGRAKDLIILRGRNHYPQDIERTAEAAHRDLRPGCGAAFSVEVEGEERLVVIYEVERRPQETPEVIAEAVRRRVSEVHEVQVHDVVLIRIATVAKTSSGKIQRHACRQEYLDDQLKVVGQSRLAESAAPLGPEVVLDADLLRASEEDQRPALLLAFLQDRVARLSKVPTASVDLDAPLTALGLDSLTSVQLKHEVEERLPVQLPLEHLLDGVGLRRLGADLLQQIDQGDASGAGGPATRAPFPIATPPENEHPLSHGQRALWYLYRLDPQSSAYHIGGAARLDGHFQIDKLHKAAKMLVRRHAVLRTSYHDEGGEPLARVADTGTLDFFHIDAYGWNDEAIVQRLTDEAERPFDLTHGPVLRLGVLHGDTADHLLLAVHHLAGDFWSLAVLLRELSILYGIESGVHGDATEPSAPPRLEPIEATYGDFVRHQAQELGGPRGDALWTYWSEVLAGDLPVLDLPTDRPRPVLQSFRGALAHRTFEADVQQSLRQVSKQHGATFYMTLLSLYQILLSRFSRQEDILVGSPFTQRSHASLSPLVGYLVNPLVLRGDLSRPKTFADLLGATRGQVLGAMAHRDMPFPLLNERLGLSHDASRSPVFQALFVLQRDRLGEEGVAAFSLGQGGAALPFAGQTLEAVELQRRSAQFDVALYLADTVDGLRATFEYNADLFDPSTIERLLDGLMLLAQAVAEDPKGRLSRLPVISETERDQLLLGAQTPPLEDTDGRFCMHHVVLRQAEKTPDQVAIRWYPEDAEAQLWTYRQLASHSHQVAGELRRLGIGPGHRVAICSARRPELVSGLLAILRCGATYVPLDPAYPGPRLEFILDDSQASALVMHHSLPESLQQVDLPTLDMAVLTDDGRSEATEVFDLEDGFHPDQLAYLIYTSGSTGRPKGVAIGHRSAVTLLRWGRREFSAEHLQRVLAATSVCFDLSIYEIFLPLSIGGQVVMAEHALELPRLPEEAAVTLVNTVPSAMAQLAGELPASVHIVNLAGEPLVRNLVDRIYAQDSVQGVFNLYGPSEDTTYSTWTRVPKGAHDEPTIGLPVAHTRAFLVDRHGHLVPRGVAGELLLGGEGLAQGYLGRPELTAEKFVPDPFSETPGCRLYRTGDLARFGADGELHFLGRLDHQVKIRGFRIELGEIEKALESHPEVDKSVVMAKTHLDEPTLVAYVARGGEALESGELRSFVGSRLPAYMVPQAIVQMDVLPLTPNGKIDRKALPEPQWEVERQDFVPPSTAVEEILAEIWQEVLGVERIGIHDSFFDLGGHSLLATRVLSRVQEAFGVDLSVRSLLEAPTLLGLSEAIAEQLLAEADDETLAALMEELEGEDED